MVIYILLILMLIFCTVFKSKRSLHMLQQNLYNENNRYIKWMIKNNKIFFDLDLSILLISLSFSCTSINSYSGAYLGEMLRVKY